MNLNPEMLVLAREAKGIVQGDFAKLMRVSQGTVSRWETGLLEPPAAKLEEFGELLDVAPEFFGRSERVYGFNSTVFFHRRRQSGTDKILRKLHARMNILRMRIGVLLRSAQIESPHTVEHFDASEYQGRIETIAQMVRAHWRMAPGYVRSVVKSIEDAGGILFRMDFETRSIDAISEWVPGYPPIIVVNSNAEIPASRLRHTLAHELGHLVLHQLASARDAEPEADRFAAEFLMPRREIKASLYRLNLSKLLDLKQEWKVSMASLVYHANRLGTITPFQYKNLYVNLRRRWGLHEPYEEHIPEEKPALLQEIIGVHTAEFKYGPGEMAKLLFYTKRSDFEAEFLNAPKMRLVS
jgi:Zn-dependent peptidase ImmA (M78 family)